MCERDAVHASAIKLDNANCVFCQERVETSSLDIFRKLSGAETQLAAAILSADIDV